MNAQTKNVQENVQEKSQQVTRDDVIEMRQLLECGCHFGHQTKRWNPKMKPYIFTSRNGIHVIDLQKSIKIIKDLYVIVKDIVAKKGDILFVGTKKQAQEAIESESQRCSMPFVSHRWLGGTLTNHMTIRQSINKLKKFESQLEDGTFDQLSNKEASKKKKALVRLQHYLGGIKNMAGAPSAVFIVDTKREQLAVNEAKKLNIPIIGLVDTNADPTEVDYPIPGNDDAIRAIKLICSVMANAINEGLVERAEIELEQDRIRQEKEAIEQKKRDEESAKAEIEAKKKAEQAAQKREAIKKVKENLAKEKQEKEAAAKKEIKSTEVKKEAKPTTAKKIVVKKAAPKTEEKETKPAEKKTVAKTTKKVIKKS